MVTRQQLYHCAKANYRLIVENSGERSASFKLLANQSAIDRVETKFDEIRPLENPVICCTPPEFKN